MKIYTRTGDRGETALFGGGRVPKDDARVTAYGQIDELNAVLGLVCATEPRAFELALLESVQRDLFSVGGLLASPDPSRVSKALEKTKLTDANVLALERTIDRIESALPPLEHFILPGGTPKAAYLHLARTVCRRAERSVVALHGHAKVPAEILTYLNRLSDLLFMLARLANHQAGLSDTIW